MDSVELLMAVEEELGIQISDDEASQIRTPRNFIDVVTQKFQGRMTRTEIAAFIKKVVVDVLGIDESEYDEDADFVRDLRMD